MVVVGRTASIALTDKGTATVKKDDRKNNAAAATAVEATRLEAVTIALPEIAGSLREGLLAWPSTPACR